MCSKDEAALLEFDSLTKGRMRRYPIKNCIGLNYQEAINFNGKQYEDVLFVGSNSNPGKVILLELEKLKGIYVFENPFLSHPSGITLLPRTQSSHDLLVMSQNDQLILKWDVLDTTKGPVVWAKDLSVGPEALLTFYCE